MNLESVLEQRAKVEAFQRKHRVALLTLLFTDLVGSTKLKQDLGDHQAVNLIQRHHALLREVLSRFKEGEEIETAGDSFFIVFTKPSDAVRFSLMLQAGLRVLDQEMPRRLKDRIGLHIGEVVIAERSQGPKPKDLYGLQVDICARVASLAEGNQILMTRSVFDNARQVLNGQEMSEVKNLSWLNHGPYLLKGVEEPMEICEVGESDEAVLKPPADSEKVHRYVSPGSEPVLGWRPALGQTVPGTRWELTEKLGEGGFGEVWLGRHASLKQPRVFKFCFRAERVRSLKREVTLFRLLKERAANHPNLVQVHDVYFDQPPFYIELDYVEGRDLKSWCEAQGGLHQIPLATRLEIVAQVADALQAAHAAGVIHRDVKPSNILVESREPRVEGQTGYAQHSAARHSTLDAQPTVKLTDFGIGKVVSQESLAGLTKLGFTQTMIGADLTAKTGTQMYMAPELFEGLPASPQSDVYSLGVVLYQLLVWDLSRPLPTDWEKDIADPTLREDLIRCVAREPQQRLSAAGDLAANLRSLDKRQQALAGQSLKHRKNHPAFKRGLVHGSIISLMILGIILRPILSKEAQIIWDLQKLKDKNVDIRLSAARELAIRHTHFSHERVVAALFRSLNDEDVNVRCWAAWGWLMKSTPGKESAFPLMKLLQDKELDSAHKGASESSRGSPFFRVHGRDQAYFRVHGNDQEYIDERNVRQKAALALERLGAEAKEAVPVLVEVLKDPQFEFTRTVLQVLQRLGSEAKAGVPTMLGVLDDTNPCVRWRTAEALARLGPGAQEAIPKLTELLKDPHLPIRWSAALAIVAIQPNQSAVPVLVESLNKGKFSRELLLLSQSADTGRKLMTEMFTVYDLLRIRCRAAEALGQMGADAKDAVLPLAHSLVADPLSGSNSPFARHPNAGFRWYVTEALRKIGPEAKEAVPTLTAALKDPDWELRYQAALILGSIGSEAKPAIPALTEAAKDKIVFVREASAEALKLISANLSVTPSKTGDSRP